MSREDARQLLVVTLGQLLLNLGDGIIPPILPTLAEELGIGAVGIGAIMSAPSMASMACNLPAGILCDRFGRVPSMVGGEAASGFGILGFTTVASSLPAMLACRLLLGAGTC